MTVPGMRYTVGKMKIDLKFISLGLLVLLLGFGAGYFLQKPDNVYRDPDLTLSADPECVLNEAACKTSIIDDGTIDFSIRPRPILGASPLSFTLSTENIEIKGAALDLSGVDMNMGSYRFELEADTDGGYGAAGNLPVCVRNQMQWQADLWLNTRNHGLIKVPYIFTAYKY